MRKLSAAYLHQTDLINEDDAQMKAPAWPEDFNTRRPHSSLGNLTLTEFALRSAASVQPTASLQQHCEFSIPIS
ncbi:MAG: transposase [bacterium]|nr:transposase [bacterium]